MVNYEVAIKRPFKDVKKLLIGIVISMIPIVNLIAAGYFLKCANSGMKKNFRPLVWEKWGDLFIKGLVALAIGLIYAIPLIIALFWVFKKALGGLMLAAYFNKASSFGAEAGLANIPFGFGAIFVIIILAFVIGYVSSGAILNYARTWKFESAFAFKEIFRRIFRGTYFVTWILGAIYVAIVSVVLSFIFFFAPWIGTGIASFVTGVTYYTLLGQAFATKR